MTEMMLQLNKIQEHNKELLLRIDDHLTEYNTTGKERKLMQDRIKDLEMQCSAADSENVRLRELASIAQQQVRF